jgi:hypothetical protein
MGNPTLPSASEQRADLATWQEFMRQNTEYDPDLNVHIFTGHGPPTVGLWVPDTAWGELMYPNLAGQVYFGGMDWSGGLADFGAYNHSTGLFGAAAYDDEDDEDDEGAEDEERDWLTYALFAGAAALLLLE